MLDIGASNLDLLRSIYANWERGDLSSAAWAHPEIEMTTPDILDGDVQSVEGIVSKGLSSTEAIRHRWLSSWENFRVEVDEIKALDDERVLVTGRMSGRGRLSQAAGSTPVVNLVHLKDAKVTRLVLYADRDRAFADLGLEE